MDGTDIDNRKPDDIYRKKVSLSDSVGELEIFKLHHYPDGKVAFESSTPSVYLSVEDGGIETGSITGSGLGYTGAQFDVKTPEKFRLRRENDRTNVAIELGIGKRYLRCGLNDAGKPVLNVQGAVSTAEQFQVIVLPKED